MKENKVETISFRSIPGQKKYLIELCQENDIRLTDLMQYMTNHYIESKDVIKYVIQIKRDKL